MSRFQAYRNNFPNARLTRSKSGVLEVAFHTDGANSSSMGILTSSLSTCFIRSDRTLTIA
jgi:hypothetical protein